MTETAAISTNCSYQAPHLVSDVTSVPTEQQECNMIYELTVRTFLDRTVLNVVSLHHFRQNTQQFISSRFHYKLSILALYFTVFILACNRLRPFVIYNKEKSSPSKDPIPNCYVPSQRSDKYMAHGYVKEYKATLLYTGRGHVDFNVRDPAGV